MLTNYPFDKRLSNQRLNDIRLNMANSLVGTVIVLRFY
jgi:hypothetical protein